MMKNLMLALEVILIGALIAFASMAGVNLFMPIIEIGGAIMVIVVSNALLQFYFLFRVRV